jgi:hypothetical protein
MTKNIPVNKFRKICDELRSYDVTAKNLYFKELYGVTDRIAKTEFVATKKEVESYLKEIKATS